MEEISRKKIAIVNHGLTSGGAEKLIYDMSLELKERDVDFTIILLTSVNDVYGRRLIEQGINVIYLSNKLDVYSLKNIYRLKVILENYDIIHTHTFTDRLWTSFASLFLKKNKKYITTEHSTSNRRRSKKYFKILDRWTYSRYTTIVSITKKVQDELQSWIKLDSDYQIIENGIDLEKYINAKSISRKNLGLEEKDILVCQVGRFNKIKSHETTIEALKFLPLNYKVIFLGEGDTKTKMLELVKNYRLQKRVLFLGYIESVPEIIKMCNLSILTSKYEGLPISAIESMCLKPFIGSDVPGIKELVKDVGELFEYGNAKELSDKIQSLISDKNRYLIMKEKCHKKSLEFDIKSTVTKYLKIYN